MYLILTTLFWLPAKNNKGEKMWNLNRCVQL